MSVSVKTGSMRDNQEAISYEVWWPVKRGKWKSTTTKITVN